MNFNSFDSFDNAVEEAVKRLEKSLDIYNENVLRNNYLLEQLIQLHMECTDATQPVQKLVENKNDGMINHSDNNTDDNTSK